MKNPYYILGVERDATHEEIKRAYRKLSMKVHPDKDPDNKKNAEDFIELNKAWEILKDPIKRKLYDERGRVEDTAAKQSVYNDIYALFMAIINQDPEGYKKDIIQLILDDIDKNIEDAENKIPPLYDAISNIRKYHGKVKPKNPDADDNVFEELIEGRVKMIQDEIKYWESFPDKLKKVRGVVDLYESKTRDYSKMGGFPSSIEDIKPSSH